MPHHLPGGQQFRLRLEATKMFLKRSEPEPNITRDACTKLWVYRAPETSGS